MERTAINPPKPCFGLEQNRSNPLCPACPYQRECASVMGGLENRVDVDKVPFNFMPTGLVKYCPEIDLDDPDSHDVAGAYEFCFKWVFNAKSRSRLDKFVPLIKQRAKEAGASIKLFLLTNMVAWDESHHGTRFTPKVLITDFSVEQVKVFAKTCQKEFGTFSLSTLDQLVGNRYFKPDLAEDDFDAHLLNSEVIAGTWIVNYKMFHSGDLIKRLYAEEEAALHPFWLATEPSYSENILCAHLNAQLKCDELLRKHRWNTVQVTRRLKKSTSLAVRVFLGRERIMPEAIRRVLGKRGLLAEHFQMKAVPVTAGLKFWGKLAVSIQHYECLKFVDNYSSLFDSHFKRI